MKFFLPETKTSDYGTTYDGIVGSVKDQLGATITGRRIFSIDYTHDKKKLHAQVGGLDPQLGRYRVHAIFESKPHIIFTRATNGDNGLTIMVNSDEVTQIEDFH